MRTTLWLSSILALLLSGCGGGDEGGGGFTPIPAATCGPYKTTAEVEQKIILPKCGKVPGCHGDTFPPKFTTAAMVKPAWLSGATQLLCRKDPYINKTEPGKSFVLAKTHAKGENLVCPSGGTAGSGGLKMPYMPDPPLPKDELDCLTWYVYELAAGR